MPHHTEWLLESQVIYNRLYGHIIEEEVAQSNATVIELMRQAESPVHIIVDTLDIEKMSIPVMSLKRISSFTSEPNLGMVIIASGDKYVTFMGSMVTQVAGIKTHFVKTKEDALQKLNRVIPDMPELELVPVE